MAGLERDWLSEKWRDWRIGLGPADAGIRVDEVRRKSAGRDPDGLRGSKKGESSAFWSWTPLPLYVGFTGDGKREGAGPGEDSIMRDEGLELTGIVTSGIRGASVVSVANVLARTRMYARDNHSNSLVFFTGMSVPGISNNSGSRIRFRPYVLRTGA